MVVRRLVESDIDILISFVRREEPFIEFKKNVAERYCCSEKLFGVQTYGVFCESKLVSIMTATFSYVFPNESMQTGKVVYISGVYTMERFRNEGYASALIEEIERDAKLFGADYLCCDSVSNGLYLKNGFVLASAGETKLWKEL